MGQANIKLTDHQADIFQKSKNEMIKDVRKKFLGPYVFKIHGKTYHVISEDLPEDWKYIIFFHLYKVVYSDSYMTPYYFHVLF